MKDYLQTIGNKNFPIVADSKNISAEKNRYMMVATMILADLFIRGGNISFEEKNEKLYCSATSDAAFALEKAETVRKTIYGENIEAVAWLAPAFFLKKYATENELPISFKIGDTLELVIG